MFEALVKDFSNQDPKLTSNDYSGVLLDFSSVMSNKGDLRKLKTPTPNKIYIDDSLPKAVDVKGIQTIQPEVKKYIEDMKLNFETRKMKVA